MRIRLTNFAKSYIERRYFQCMEIDEDELHQRILEIFHDENKAGIYTILRLYAPMNLKGIARVLGKAESTLHPHLKKLFDEEIIEIDEVVSNRYPGKFYRVKQEIVDLYESEMRESLATFEERSTKQKEIFETATASEENSEDREIAAKILRDDLSRVDSEYKALQSNFSINKGIQNIVLQNFNKLIDLKDESTDKLFEEFAKPDYVPSLNHYMRTFRMVDRNDSLKFTTALVDLVRKIHQMEDEIERRIKEQEIDEDTLGIQYIYLFTGPLPTDIGAEGAN